MTDTNEVTGFVSNCTNTEWLRTIRYAIDQRLLQLLPPAKVAELVASRKPPEKDKTKES